MYDVRDANAYTIRKLADGNCWMTENLRKELAENEVLTPATSDVLTDVTVGAATQPYNQASTNYYDWGVASTSDFSEATVDRWLSRSTKKDGVWTTETTPVQSGAPSADLTGEDQKTGVYYNWYAATAGTGTWSMTTSGTEASSSVCPAGWQLPRYSAVNGTSTLAPSGSWMHLIRDVYGVIKNQGDQSTVADGNLNANAELHAFPFSLPYSGDAYWQSGGTTAQGAGGYFWSAGAATQTTARFFYFGVTSVRPENSAYRLDGISVRCVADDSTPGTLTVTPSTIDADTATTVNVSIPLSGDYNANISLGDTALTCSRTSTSPLSFSCSVPSTTSGTYTLTASLPGYGKNYTGTLTVNPNLSGMCSATSVGSTFTYSGVQYIKLNTNPAGTTSACYTKTSQGSVTWDNAASVCPANTGIPTQEEFQSLRSAYGSDGTLYDTTGWSGTYWSSTEYEYNTSFAYVLYIDGSVAGITNRNKASSYSVVCIVR